MKDVLKYLNAKKMHEDYFPNVKSFSNKLSGKAAFGRVMHFNESDKEIIMQGIRNWMRDVEMKYSGENLHDAK